jgi:tetratricopeptide (TPR) repeat protein
MEILAERLVKLCSSPELRPEKRASGLCWVGALSRFRGQLDEAEERLEEAMEIARRAELHKTQGELRLELARLWMQQGRLDDARLELEPLIWEASRPDLATGYALVVWGELELREGERARATVRLREALEHARLGGWRSLEIEVLDLLGVATLDPRYLEEAAQRDRKLGGRIRREALHSLVAAQRGEAPAARMALERARREAERLGLGPTSEPAFWLQRAEEALASTEGTLIPGKSGGNG